MNENIPDGAEDLNRSLMRTTLALGGRLGEILARQRAEHREQMLRAAVAERQRLEERFEAERAVMHAELAAVHQPRFWDSATPEQVGERYAQARHWEPFDDMARASRQRMEDEISTRCDLNPEQYLSRTPQTPPDQEQGAEQASGLGRGAADVAAAGRLSAAVARGDQQNDLDAQNAAAAAEELWDSGARREELAENLKGRFGGTPEGRDGTEAVLAADRDNGTHPAAAVQKPGRAVKGRKYGSRGRGKTSELGR